MSNEKNQLEKLNDQFSSYLGHVRFLEMHNEKLKMEISLLTKKQGIMSQKIERMYQIELDEARALLKEICKRRATFELKVDEGEFNLDDSKKR